MITTPGRSAEPRGTSAETVPSHLESVPINPAQSGVAMDPAVASYVNAIPVEHRALFDRIHRLILDTCPEASVVLSYKMPTYQFGRRRLHLGGWKHGVSIYGWKAHGDGGFTARHPDLQTSTGTIRIRADAAAAISDDDFRDLARGILTPDGSAA